MQTLIKYIVVLAVIAVAVFLLSQNGVSFLPESDTEQVRQNAPVPPTTTAMRADVQTNFGVITVELFPDVAPKTVENFVKLAGSGFYNSTKFHRVIKDFMIQGGDPNSKDGDWSDDGRGGPGYAFEDEINSHKLVRGALAMANSGPNTNGSQFFIVTANETPWLDGKHTVFGQVIGGMDIVSRIEALKTNKDDHPLEDAIIERITTTQ